MRISTDQILLGDKVLEVSGGLLHLDGAPITGGGAGLSTVLTGFVSESGGDVLATDTILEALEKLNYNVNLSISSLGGTVNGNLVVSGLLSADRVKFNSISTAYASSVNLDFDNKSWVVLGQLTGNITFTTSNAADGKELSVKLLGDAATTRTLAFPAWTWVGGVAPASIAAGKVAILSIRCFGVLDSDIVASYAVQS